MTSFSAFTIRISVGVILLTFLSNVIAISLEFDTDSCQLKEPIYNYTFDFSKLHSDLAHIIKSSNGDIFEFNLCGNLTKSCGNNTNVAACLTRNNKQHILGLQHTLTYKKGNIYFNFTNGEQCKNNKNFELQVLLSCDYTLDAQQLEITSYDNENCNFYIKLETPYACLPDNTKSNKCSVTNNSGFTYNLMPLSDFNEWTSDRNDSYFVINVCRPVLYSQGAMCPAGSSICFVDKSENNMSKKFINYGSATTKVELLGKNGLVMKHFSDEKCNEKENYTSTIFFTCYDFNTGKPVFFNREGCNFNFLWETSLACEKLDFCSAVDPVHAYKYDLSPLAKQNYNVTSKDGINYSFAICSGLLNDKSNAGASKIENNQHINLGVYREHLYFSNTTGLPYLLYESGSKCSDNKNWSTKIEFFCPTPSSDNNENIDFGPKIVENSNCLIQIHFQTKLACKKHITCKAQAFLPNSKDEIEEKYDLTLLMSSTENYVARVNESLSDSKKNVKYFLNVCRPLVPEANVGCTGGSAVCMGVMDTGIPEKEKSLGYPEVSLAITGNNQVELNYLNGDICPDDNSKTLSSTINFMCNTKAGKGTPILQSINDKCHYKFDWPTSMICPEHLCKFNVDGCEIINENLNEKYHIKDAKFTKNGIIMIDESKLYTIDICSQHIRTVITDYSQSMVKVFLSTNKSCSAGGTDGSSGSDVHLRLICSNIEHRSISTVDDACIMVITQKTPEICKFLGLELPNINNGIIKSTTTIPTLISTLTTTTLTTVLPPTPNKITTIKTLLSPILPLPSVATNATTNSLQTNEDNLKGLTNTTTTNTTSNVSMSVLLLTLLMSVSFLVASGIFIIRNQTARERLQRIFRRNSSNGVQYSRVDANEEASLLLGPSGRLEDSDDEMLL